MTPELHCWNCGALLIDIPRPISRHANCPECFNELHCCRLCSFFDPSISTGQCEEERADPPVIKDGANFCEWFQPKPGAYSPRVTGKRNAALSRLDALFGEDSEASEEASEEATEKPPSAPLSKEDEARAELNRIFSAKDPIACGNDSSTQGDDDQEPVGGH